MPDGSFSFHVPRPPEVVFDFLSDLERAPQWAEALASVERTTPGDLGTGTRYRGSIVLAGRSESGEIEIIEFERPRAFAYAGQGGPARFTAHFELLTVTGGTQLDHRYSLQLSGIAKMMEPMLRPKLEENAASAMAALRAAIESAT